MNMGNTLFGAYERPVAALTAWHKLGGSNTEMSALSPEG